MMVFESFLGNCEYDEFISSLDEESNDFGFFEDKYFNINLLMLWCDFFLI